MSVFYAMSTYAKSERALMRSSDAKSQAKRASTDVDFLKARLDRTLLVCEALWTILRDRLNLTEQELIDRVQEVDLSDGKLDGKVRRKGVFCPACGRKVTGKFPHCMYCGEEIERDPFA
ncbi:MAG: hypothetical protein ACYTHM_13435 [Planctomycetota bacterium]|jgi:hypothetical protein